MIWCDDFIASSTFKRSVKIDREPAFTALVTMTAPGLKEGRDLEAAQRFSMSYLIEPPSGFEPPATAITVLDEEHRDVLVVAWDNVAGEYYF